MEDRKENGPLHERVILVTGASSGVGYGVARRLVQLEGATVVAIGRRRVYRIEALAQQVGQEKLIVLTGDMSVREQAESLVAQVKNRLGRMDGFVHAIHRSLRMTALEVSGPEFDLTMQVNVKSALNGVQAIAPLLRQQGKGGAIIIYNPVPIETIEFGASEAVDTASVHALSALTAGWARQLSGSGILVREIAPAPAADIFAPEWHLAADEHLVVGLRDAFAALVQRDRLEAGSSAAPLPPMPAHSPIVLSKRGGLALTQFGS